MQHTQKNIPFNQPPGELIGIFLNTFTHAVDIKVAMSFFFFFILLFFFYYPLQL